MGFRSPLSQPYLRPTSPPRCHSAIWVRWGRGSVEAGACSVCAGVLLAPFLPLSTMTVRVLRHTRVTLPAARSSTVCALLMRSNSRWPLGCRRGVVSTSTLYTSFSLGDRARYSSILLRASTLPSTLTGNWGSSMAWIHSLNDSTMGYMTGTSPYGRRSWRTSALNARSVLGLKATGCTRDTSSSCFSRLPSRFAGALPLEMQEMRTCANIHSTEGQEVSSRWGCLGTRDQRIAMAMIGSPKMGASTFMSHALSIAVWEGSVLGAVDLAR
mmetsp:Transcript_35611/g.79152  ORF Transcript_35611/g.79152 Transcript_35611/m.79152 type:complete len:270 (+) Transcript_35611:996-1805(+)